MFVCVHFSKFVREGRRLTLCFCCYVLGQSQLEQLEGSNLDWLLSQDPSNWSVQVAGKEYRALTRAISPKKLAQLIGTRVTVLSECAFVLYFHPTVNWVIYVKTYILLIICSAFKTWELIT